MCVCVVSYLGTSVDELQTDVGVTFEAGVVQRRPARVVLVHLVQSSVEEQ
jgi:hypothetical protein